MRNPIQVSVLGEFLVLCADGERARFRTNRAAEVVARLALQDSRKMQREELALELWPDAERPARLANLRPALSYARTALGSAEALTQDGEMIALSAQVGSDWQEAARLEGQAQALGGQEQQLIALYALHEALRPPLLRGWKSEWIDRFRDYHARRQAAVLRQIAEATAARGDWVTSLEHARQMAELDPLDEEGIRLQLRALGGLGRLSEAQRAYTDYGKLLQSELGLKPSAGLRQLADEVVSGRIQARGASTTGAQMELLWQILNMLVEESPERVLPLLASPKLNWSIAVSGPDLRMVTERVFRRTTGWGQERVGVAKRLLQIYTQEIETDLILDLAAQLLANGQESDRVAALNFLAIAEQNRGGLAVAEEHLREAIRCAHAAGQTYFAAVSRANLGMLFMRAMRLDEAERELVAVMADLAQSNDPSATLGISVAKGSLAVTQHLAGSHAAARAAIDDWAQFAWANGTMTYDSMGKGALVLITAREESRTALSNLLTAVHSAMADRNATAQLGILPLLVSAVRGALGEPEADELAGMVEAIFVARKLAILPSTRALIGPPQPAPARVTSPFDVYLRIRTLVLLAS